MNILDTKIGSEVLTIINRNGKVSYSKSFRATVLTPGFSVPMKMVSQLLVSKDFVNSATPAMTLIGTVSLMEYEQFLLPSQKDLLLDLEIFNLNNTRNKDNGRTVRYRAKLITNTIESLITGNNSGTTLKERDEVFYPIAIELIDLAYDKVRNYSLSGTVIKDASVSDIIYTLASNFGNLAIDLHTPDNTNRINDLVIPDGVIMYGIANWLQNTVGVYCNGINTFIQNNWVYIYPLSLLTSVSKRKKISIVRASPTDLMGVESTASMDGDHLYLLSTGEARVTDDEDALEDTLGNSVRWSNPDYLGSKMARLNNVSSLTANGYYTYANDQRNLVQSKVHELNTINKCKEISRINQTKGFLLELTVSNLDTESIEPNTEVTVYYIHNDTVNVLSGVLLGINTTHTREVEKRDSDKFNTGAVLKMRVVSVDSI